MGSERDRERSHEEREGFGVPEFPSERDPRLEIPEVLRTPVKRPASMQPKPPSGWASTAKAWGIALDFVVSVLGGVVLGWLLDRAAGTGPWGVLGGLTLGLAAAFVRIVRASSRL